MSFEKSKEPYALSVATVFSFVQKTNKLL